MQIISAHAQSPLREPTAWRIGLFGSYGINYHNARFDALPGTENLTDTMFGGGGGLGFTISGFFEKPLSHSFSLAARGSFTQADGTFRSSTETFFSTATGELVIGRFDNVLATRINTITADPLIAWHPFFGVSVYAGVRLGVSFGTASLTRAITEETGEITFAQNGKRELPQFTDSVMRSFFLPQIGATIGASYAIPLNPQETFFLAPEVWYTHGLTPQVGTWNDGSEGNFWNVHYLRGGISFRYSPEAPRIFLPPAIVRTAETRQLAINITPIAVDSTGAESALLRLFIEEVPSRQMHPLLPMIFFDKNADSLPSRYVRLTNKEIAGFSEEQFTRWGTLEIYYHVLSILGKRMKSRPASTLRLVGTLSEDEANAGVDLGSRRAEAIMMYLRDVWRISPERITIESRIIPTKPTVFAKKTGQALANEENRRVELSSDDWEILRPLTLNDTLRESSPMAIKFLLRADTRQPIKQWLFTLEQGKRTLRKFSGTGAPPEEFIWHPAREQSGVPRTEDVVRCNFDFIEQSSEGATATISMPVEQTTLLEKSKRNEGTRRTDVYRILNADNATPALPNDIERVMKEITEQRILARAVVTATGYNDKTSDTFGNAAQNLALSKERASAVAKALTNIISPGNHVPTPLALGRGGKFGIYPEFTPEGRYYSRMVEIRVDTPKE
jgi:outer membrane protein OmpA-like peptidoglycan-associated protein